MQQKFSIRESLARIFAGAPRKFALPCPKTPIAVIGDIHGRSDLLSALLALLQQQPNEKSLRYIFVGDLIDRGPQSAQVLDIVRTKVTQEPDRHICLMGNHERMMLDFLNDPETCGPRWFNAGGIETIFSFDINAPLLGRMTAADYRATAEALQDALPEGMVNWILNLPLIWHQNEIVVSHAGGAPGVPLDQQSGHDLLWGHPDFLCKARKDGHWMAHGHFSHTTATAEQGRISTDTGAWKTGRLNAALIDENGVSFVEATDKS